MRIQKYENHLRMCKNKLLCVGLINKYVRFVGKKEYTWPLDRLDTCVSSEKISKLHASV